VAKLEREAAADTADSRRKTMHVETQRRAPLRAWGARELVKAWLAYWAVLASVVFGPTLWTWYRLQSPDQHGSVSWSYSGSFLGAALWVAGPPLVVALLWLVTRPRR
jgi:hypothetical protein